VSLCIPPFCVGAGSTGSLSVSQSKAMSNYASVTEQSGLQAGDKGFQVDVKGNTDLRGAVIASTDKALHDGNNRLATRTLTKSDIENRADYSASSIGINIGTGTSLSGALAPFGSGVGFGSDSGHSASTTLSGITSIAGNIGVRTGDSATGIARIFDANKVEKDVGAQVQITQTFGQQASKAVGDYMGKQTTILKLAAGQEDDPTKKQILLDEAQKWDEGGTYRVLAHTVIGGLTGGVQGAAGASAAALYANAINKATADLPEGVRNVVGAAIASGLGAAVGGTAGAATAFNEETNNRQLHISEIEKLKRKAAELARAGLTGRDASESDRTKATNYWFDLLSSEALAIVDTKARDVRESYLAQISATRAPGLEGQLNADRYLQDAGIARQIVASMSGDILLGSDGKPITADGSVLRSFQATERQFTDTQLFLTKDSATLIAEFGSLEKASAAGAKDSSLENRVSTAGRIVREYNLLTGFSASTEGVTRVYPELDIAAGLGLAKLGAKVVAKSFEQKIATTFNYKLESSESVENYVSRSIQGMTPSQVAQRAEQLGFQTERDAAVFWSSLGPLEQGVNRARIFASNNSGVTLEMTPGGKWLSEINLYGENSPFSRIEADQIMESASRSLAQQASGQVRVLSGSIRPSSFFLKTELPELSINPAITGIDYLQLKPRYSFGEK
jgi:hypothetical protein